MRFSFFCFYRFCSLFRFLFSFLNFLLTLFLYFLCRSFYFFRACFFMMFFRRYCFMMFFRWCSFMMFLWRYCFNMLFVSSFFGRFIMMIVVMGRMNFQWRVIKINMFFVSYWGIRNIIIVISFFELIISESMISNYIRINVRLG